MEASLQVKNCLVEIKKQLKEKRMTYQQIADKLGVSILTVKRQLNADDLGFKKLLCLCDAAGLSLTEILSEIEDKKVRHTSFTEEQDLAFCENESLYHYFTELFFNKKSPEIIQSNYHLTPASSHRYLRKLEDIGLISLSIKGKVSFLVEAPIGFVESTQFVLKEIENALQTVSKRLAEASKFEDYIVVKPLSLPNALLKQMHNEIEDIVSHYAELSERFYVGLEYPHTSLVICGYNNQTVKSSPTIKNFD
ncbi:hypothetical protein [Agaribacter flavus]|uniref:HTH cro/C1-type domain-containing protein n=1 Tax=Agaribacter flavus TaxID=1902781 RepID=A0ABV7FP95_9ALTE